MDLIRARLATLTNQEQVLAGQMTRQEAEMERIREIREQGLAAQTRVVEEQRAYDSLQARAADNATETAAVRSQLEAAEHELQRFDDRRTAGLEAEKQAALVETGRLQGSLWGIDERLAQLGATGATDLQVTVYREAQADASTPGDPNTVLGPGDTIDVVALPSLPAPSAPPVPAAGVAP